MRYPSTATDGLSYASSGAGLPLSLGDVDLGAFVDAMMAAVDGVHCHTVFPGGGTVDPVIKSPGGHAPVPSWHALTYQGDGGAFERNGSGTNDPGPPTAPGPTGFC